MCRVPATTRRSPTPRRPQPRSICTTCTTINATTQGRIIIRQAAVETRDRPMDMPTRTTRTACRASHSSPTSQRDQMAFTRHRPTLESLIIVSCHMIQLMCCRRQGESKTQFNFAWSNDIASESDKFNDDTSLSIRMVNERDVFGRMFLWLARRGRSVEVDKRERSKGTHVWSGLKIIEPKNKIRRRRRFGTREDDKGDLMCVKITNELF